jgi:hypothetical protein
MRGRRREVREKGGNGGKVETASHSCSLRAVTSPSPMGLSSSPSCPTVAAAELRTSRKKDAGAIAFRRLSAAPLLQISADMLTTPSPFLAGAAFGSSDSLQQNRLERKAMRGSAGLLSKMHQPLSLFSLPSCCFLLPLTLFSSLHSTLTHLHRPPPPPTSSFPHRHHLALLPPSPASVCPQSTSPALN